MRGWLVPAQPPNYIFYMTYRTLNNISCNLTLILFVYVANIDAFARKMQCHYLELVIL